MLFCFGTPAYLERCANGLRFKNAVETRNGYV